MTGATLGLAMKSWLRDFVVPPGLYRLAHRVLGTAGRKPNPMRFQLPHSWKGETFGPVRGAMRVPAEKIGAARVVTRGGESRASVPVSPDETLAIDGLPAGSTHLEFAVAAGDPRQPPADVEITLNGKPAARLIGPLAPECWHHLRLGLDPGRPDCKLAVSYAGKALYLSDPVPLRPSDGTKPNIVVLVLDSLKPEQLGCYRSATAEPTDTPAIDRFFANGRRFENAYCQGDATLSNTASMATGLYPIQHGVYVLSRNQRELPLGIPTLAEILAEAGYRTFCYSSATPFMPRYGFYRGFEQFLFHHRDVDNTSDKQIRRATEFIEGAGDRPFFCLLHLFDLHPPFALPTYYADLAAGGLRWGDGRELYNRFKRTRTDRELVTMIERTGQAKLHEVDLRLGRLFMYLEEKGLSDSTVVVLTSDHGQDLSKRNPWLSRDRTRVPFLIRGPAVGAGVERGFVETSVDLYPTVLRLAGMPVPEHAVGRDLLEPANGHRAFSLSELLDRDFYEVVVREMEWSYCLRFPMNVEVGEVDIDEPIGEWLFSENRATGREGGAHNRLMDEPMIAKRWRESLFERPRLLGRHFGPECTIEETRAYQM